MIKKVLKTITYSLLALFILLATTLTFLVTTTPGLYVSVKLAQWVLPGKIKMKQAEGRLLDGFRLKNISYKDKSTQFVADQLELKWDLHSLWHKKLIIEKLSAQYILYETTPADTEPEKESADTSLSLPQLPRLPVQIHINSVHINLLRIKQDQMQETLKNVHLYASFTNEAWQLTQLKGQYARHRFNLSAKLKPTANLPVEAKLHIEPISRQSDAVHGDITIGGDHTLYYWHGQFSNPGNLTFNGSLKNGRDISSKLSYKNLNWLYKPGQRIKSREGQVTIKGHLPHMVVDFSSDIQSPWPASVNFHLENKPHSLTLNGMVQKAQQTVRFSLEKKAKGTPDLNGRIQFSTEKNGLNAAITVQGHLNTPNQQTLKVHLAPGEYQANNLDPLHFKGGSITAQLTAKGLSAQGNLMIYAGQQATFSLNMPGYSTSKPSDPKQPVQGELLIHMQSLDFIKQLNENITNPKGRLQARLLLNGTLSDPQIKGSVDLIQAGLALPRVGITLEPVTFSLKADDKSWQLDSSMFSNKEPLNIKGSGVFYPEFRGSLLINGSNFPVIKTKEYSVNISPDLKFDFGENKYQLDGKITIPQASLKPMSFSSSTAASDDIVFVHEDEDMENTTLPLFANIELIMGEQVEMNVKGLKGNLKGALTLTEQPNNPLRAKGELNVENGKYKAYGQDLTLEQGQLLYVGETIANPNIKIRAVRQLNNVGNSTSLETDAFDFTTNNLPNFASSGKTTVGVEVSGRLNSPHVKLFSIPATYSQADILSLLLLGKPASQASRSGSQLLLTAITSMNLDSGAEGTQLMDSVKKNLGIDFSLESGTQINEATHETKDSTSFVVSKSLSKRLMLSYNLGILNSNTNMLTLRYLLNRFFSIQVNTGVTANGIDLLYTYQQQDNP